MSLSARKELLARVRKKYHDANWKEKGKILNELIAITGYRRKYADRYCIDLDRIFSIAKKK
jgi:hypothetical protein